MFTRGYQSEVLRYQIDPEDSLAENNTDVLGMFCWKILPGAKRRDGNGHCWDDD